MMKKNSDLLYVNATLFKAWFAHINSVGWPTGVTYDLKKKVSFLAELTNGFLGLNPKVNCGFETEKGVTSQHLPEVANVAMQLVEYSNLFSLVASYHTAVKKEAEGVAVRYVLMHGVISWLPQTQQSDWIGDIVIPAAKDDKGRWVQHIIEFNNDENVMISPVGAHCRWVNLLAFWQGKFRPSSDASLTSCCPIMVWE